MRPHRPFLAVAVGEHRAGSTARILGQSLQHRAGVVVLQRRLDELTLHVERLPRRGLLGGLQQPPPRCG